MLTRSSAYTSKKRGNTYTGCAAECVVWSPYTHCSDVPVFGMFTVTSFTVFLRPCLRQPLQQQTDRAEAGFSQALGARVSHKRPRGIEETFMTPTLLYSLLCLKEETVMTETWYKCVCRRVSKEAWRTFIIRGCNFLIYIFFFISRTKKSLTLLFSTSCSLSRLRSKPSPMIYLLFIYFHSRLLKKGLLASKLEYV